MIVCICANVSDKKIIEALKSGTAPEEVMVQLNCSMQCGYCFDEFTQIVKDVQNEKEI